MNAPKKLTWNQQKELIRFFIDGSGTIQPASDDEANFANDLLVLILRSCKDTKYLERDIKKFTEARAHEISDEPVSKDDVRRIRQRYFGFLRSESTAEEIQQRNFPLDLNKQFEVVQLLQQNLVIDHPESEAFYDDALERAVAAYQKREDPDADAQVLGLALDILATLHVAKMAKTSRLFREGLHTNAEIECSAPNESPTADDVPSVWQRYHRLLASESTAGDDD
jgi:hypothetical protein